MDRPSTELRKHRSDGYNFDCGLIVVFVRAFILILVLINPINPIINPRNPSLVHALILILAITLAYHSKLMPYHAAINLG